MYRYFIAILALSFCLPAFAKDYSITDLLTTAEQNSGNIQAAEYFAKSQEGIARQQKYWNNPSIGYDGGGREGSSFNVSQTIPFVNKLQRKYDIENAEYNILQTRRQDVALFVKAEVYTLAYQYYGIEQKISLLEKRLARLASVDRYLSNIVVVSPTKHAQVEIVKDKISLLERDLVTLQNLLYQTWNRMNVFLRLENKPELSIKWTEVQAVNRDDFIKVAIENNLDLKQQKQLIDKYKSEASFAKVEQMPDVSVSAGQYQGNSMTGSSPRIGVSLSVPLFNRNQQKISGLETKVKAQETQYHFETNQLTKLVDNELNQYKTVTKIAKSFPVSRIDRAITKLNSANASFQKGILDFITYIELDSQEYEIINTAIDAQVEVAESYAKLMIQRGEFILPRYE